MSVARISRPQLLYASLRPSEEPVDVQTVGVGRHLRRDPDRQPHQRFRQRLAQPEGSFEMREADLDLLPPRRPAARSPGREQDPAFGQPPPERAVLVGEIPEEPPRDFALLQVRPRQEFLDEQYV